MKSEGSSVLIRGESSVDDRRVVEDQRRQADRAAAETLTLLDTLLSKAPVGFGFVDRAFRFVRVNEVLAQLNGCSVEESIGRTVAEVVPDVWTQVAHLYRRVLETGQSATNVEVLGG